MQVLSLVLSRSSSAGISQNHRHPAQQLDTRESRLLRMGRLNTRLHSSIRYLDLGISSIAIVLRRITLSVPKSFGSASC